MNLPRLFDLLDDFWEQVVARRVVHAAGVYAIVTWGGAYMLATTYEALLLPDSVLRVLLALIFLGFPLILVLAWYFPSGRPALRRRSGQGSRGHALALTLLFLGAMLAGGSYAAVVDRVLPGAAEGTEDSVAVLPFEALTGGSEDGYFADGMTDEVIARLAGVPGLRVISRTSAMRYRDRPWTLDEVGRELDVALVLQGSVRRQGDRVRVTAQLLETRTARTRWAETYDRPLEDVFAIQSELANRIGESLGAITRTQDGVQRRAEAPTTDLNAYELYLAGRYFWNQRSPESLDRAIQLFREAVRLDPGFHLAHAALADAFVVLPYHSDVPAVEATEQARAAAMEALALEPELGEAHAALAFVNMGMREWSEAERGFERALALSPGYATAHQWHAALLMALGRVGEALDAIQRARSLDPLSLMINDELGLVLHAAGRSEESLARFRHTIELDSTFAPAHLHTAWVLEYRQRDKEAVEALERWAELLPNPPFQPGALRAAYAAGGPERVYTLLADLHPDARVSAVDRARWNLRLGRTDEAFRWLNRGLDNADPWISFLKVLPFTHLLHTDPRFDRLLARLQLE